MASAGLNRTSANDCQSKNWMSKPEWVGLPGALLRAGGLDGNQLVEPVQRDDLRSFGQSLRLLQPDESHRVLARDASRLIRRDPASRRNSASLRPKSSRPELDSVGNLGVWLTVTTSLRQPCGDM
jgi:hypothetical protein